MQAAARVHADAAALLHASHLPDAWAAQATWTILDTSFGAGERWLATWQAWHNDPLRPAVLHYVGHLTPAEYDRFFAHAPAPVNPTLNEGETTDIQAWRQAAAHRAPGVHRLLFDRGQVSLTLCIGESPRFLTDHRLYARTVWFSADPQPWDKWTAKALARVCARGATLIARLTEGPNIEWLREAGFVALEDDPATGAIRGTFEPAWSLGAKEPPTPVLRSAGSRHCCVVGAGIAGASVACAMARRGWHVTVLERAVQAAAGASGLPVGLVVPHISADDSPRSRLSRVGARLMLQHAASLLQQGVDWDLSGVLEHRFTEGPDRHHTHAGWIRPAALVNAWLAHPGIEVRYGADVHHLVRASASWVLQDDKESTLLEADVVVVANAFGARALLSADGMAMHRAPTLPLTLGDLQAVHGTASLGRFPDAAHGPAWAMPHNGHGCFIPVTPQDGQPWWLAGSSFEPDAQPTAASLEAHHLAPIAAQHAQNLERLKLLLPALGDALAEPFHTSAVTAWSGTRCVTHDRLPLAGPVDAHGRSGLWMHVGMGARGLTFSALGAELIAARIGAEPWPVETALARSLDSQRLRKRRAPREAESDST